MKSIMFDTIEALCLSSHKFHSKLNEHLLLAPSDGSVIPKKDAITTSRMHFLNSLLQLYEDYNQVS